MRDEEPGGARDDQWTDAEEDRPLTPRRVVVAVVVAAALAGGAFWATSLVLPDPDPQRRASGANEVVDATAANSTPATAPVLDTPRATLEIRTSPSATEEATPTPVAPTSTPVPPTVTPIPTVGPAVEPQLEAQAGAQRVAEWYDLLVARRFDDAYALWSDRMRANFPRQGNLDDRWADTAAVSINELTVVSASGERMTVAIDFVETRRDGARRRFVGTWDLIAVEGQWLLDWPNF